MKNILLALIFMGLTSPVFAQIHIGLAAGPNVSFWDWELKAFNLDLNYDPAYAWRTVLVGEWQMALWAALRAETGLHIKANRKVSYLLFESDILAGNFKGSRFVAREHYQYWESSLLVQISPLKKLRQIYLLAGGSSGWLQNGWKKTKGSESGNELISRSEIDIKDPNWNRIALAADFGLGANIPLNAMSKLKLEGRFQYSLSNLAKSDEVNARVNSLLFNVGYLHRLY